MFFSKRKLIGFAAAFLALLFILSLASSQSPYRARSGISDLTQWPLLLSSTLASELQALLLFHKNYWDNLSLRRENEKFQADLLVLQEVERENVRLRALLEFKKRQRGDLILARVIGRDFHLFRPNIVIDQGSAKGVAKYAPVLTHRGLVGKVLEVGRLASKVILINDPDLSVPVINVRTREHGLASGTLDGQCKLRFLDMDSDTKSGDLIVTSGLNLTYPPEIMVGEVSFVSQESSGLAKFALIKPAINLAVIREVFVVEQPSVTE